MLAAGLRPAAAIPERDATEVHMKDRSATSTLKGYFYQFDYTILAVLQLSKPEDTIDVECIEDVDIRTATVSSAVQCKYYEGTEYNHSVIKPAVMEMLRHFKSVRVANKSPINYVLRGHFQSGADKLVFPVSVSFVRQHFFTYVKDGKERRLFEELALDDTELGDFLSVLRIDINAPSFDEQFADVIRNIRSTYSCSQLAAEHFYYNSALATVRRLAIQKQATARSISKKSFLSEVDTSGILFDEWFVKKKGREAHFAALRREYFTNLNPSPFERFFLVEVAPDSVARSDIKDLLHAIARKWTKITQRHGNSSFCPYVYLHGLAAAELVELKKELAMEGFRFIDGYDFQGAEFDTTSLVKRASHENGITLKFVNNINDLESTLHAIKKTRHVFQFCLGTGFFDPASVSIKHVKIQVEKLLDVKSII